MYAYPTDFNTTTLYRQLEQLSGSLLTPLPDKPVKVGEFLSVTFSELARSSVHVRLEMTVTSAKGHEFCFKVHAYTTQKTAYAVTFERHGIVLNQSKDQLHNFDWSQHYKINSDFQIIMNDFTSQQIVSTSSEKEEIAA